MKINLILRALLFIFFLSSCEDKKNKTIIFDVFEITVPTDWEKINLSGIDSYTGGIVLSTKDTLFFDYGSSAPLINDVIVVEDIKNYSKMKKEGFYVENFTFSKTPNLDQNQGVFHKEYYIYDTIDNLISKIKIPKKIGDGVIAISFDSITKKRDRLYLYSKNLDTLKQFELLKAFKTIKIFSRQKGK